MKKVIILLFLGCFISSQAQDYKDVNEVKGMAVGDSVADFTAISMDSTLFSLYSELEKGPVVVMFIRGQWCPICNRHLSKVQDSLALLTNTGARLLVVSPEKPEFLEMTAGKTGGEFTLLYDSAYLIMKQFDVLFLPDEKTLKRYSIVFQDALVESHSDESQRLPVPATFIIDQDYTLHWRHFDPNYKIRASMESIIEHIPGTNTE